MAIINLCKYYYPIYAKDTFIEVPDDVAEVLEEGRLIENRQDHKRSYYHVYSIDCSPGIENYAMFLVLSPEDLMIQEIDEATAELMLVRLAEALRVSERPPARGRYENVFLTEAEVAELQADLFFTAILHFSPQFYRIKWVGCHGSTVGVGCLAMLFSIQAML